MASIYNKAERVIIWLGPPTYDTGLIMSFMKKLEEESLKYTCNNWGALDHRWEDIWSVIQTSSSASLMYRQREGLKSLLDRSWFRRVWILQKVAKARAAEVVCGTKSVSARIFALTPFIAGMVLDPHCQAVLDIMPGPSWKSSWRREKRDLQTLLTKFGKSEASDQRDVIYALLGISSDVSSSDSLKANYERSIQESIQDTTFFLLRFPKSGYPTHGFPAWTLKDFLENLDSLSNQILEWAVNIGYEAIVKLLVRRGDVDIINTVDKFGRTLLSKAAERGHEAIVRLLADGGVAVDRRDNSGERALYKAALEGHEAVVRLLVRRGADINVNGNERKIALLQAASKERGGMVRVLVDLGADINTKDKFGETALHQAAFRESDTMVRLLVGLGADINAKDRVKDTALYRAALTGNSVIVQLLVDLGADINAKDEFGETVLHRSAFRGRQTIVKLLIDSGADVNTRSNKGRTELYLAALGGNEVVVQMPKSAGAFE